MKPNFPKFFAKYKATPGANGLLKPLELIFELSSIDFDINQTTIGYDIDFSSEMSFEARLVEIVDPPNGDLSGQNAFLNNLDLGTQAGFTAFLSSEVFTKLTAQYVNLATPANNFPSAVTLSYSTPQSTPDVDLFSSVWLIQLKFVGKTPIASSGMTGIFHPEIVLQGPLSAEALKVNTTYIDDPAFAAINAELKLNYELLLLADSGGSNTNSIGKVADEIADSFADLSATIASKLSNTINARLQPSAGQITYDLALWMIIQKSTQDLSFTNFHHFMDEIFCGKQKTSVTKSAKMRDKVESLSNSRALPFMGVDGYNSLKVATEAFVMVNCMTDGAFDEETLANLNKNVPLVNGNPDSKKLDEWWNEYKEEVNGAVSTIPYLAVIRRKLKDSDLKTFSLEEALQNYLTPGSTVTETNCFGIIQNKLSTPCFLELIWSYWHEESMMVQGLNAISRRFQNIKAPGPVDPLAHLAIDPLRPLSNLLWGYLQDEQHRLTVRRRAYEYDHHYGITLQGTAVQNMRFADSRSKFIEAFHTLLNLTNKYYKQADDMTVQPDAFPILNALKEVHLVLSEGAHNQYGDLPSVARAEMLMQQWLLARPEFREFLPTRIMVAFPEPWMDRVSALNNLMGWTKTSVLHFRDLGAYGEQLLLSIRFGNWANIPDRHSAANWANFWRPQIQSYMHAYRAVTGVDLTADITTGGRIDAVQPSIHLQRRLLEQRGKVA
ncbi:MAG: hypothetical protein JNJ90_19525 [Saprospiraceae bacterium]|jgi:hypothetical protein|nr:hypothetical protein [Saprospiraceae bacterium]